VVTGPLPNHPHATDQSTAHRHPKGSDHDHHNHHGTDSDGNTADAGTNQHEEAPGDRSDSPDGEDRSDTDRTRRRRQTATAGRPERAGDGSSPPAPQYQTDAAPQRVTDKTRQSRGSGAQARSIPTPEESAQEQLKQAPERSRAWAVKVAAIYGLEIPADTYHAA
jgi:hypothetical protein